MGNQCCGNQPIQNLGEMGFAQAIPVQQTQKIQVESTRFFQVMVTQEEQHECQNYNEIFTEVGYFNQDKTENFTLTLKPYNPIETQDQISIQLKVKAHDYNYKNEFDWKIDEDVLIDPNNFETSILRGIEQKSGNKYSIKVVNFDDYEDYKFKTALYEVYVMKEIQKRHEDPECLVQIIDAYIVENSDKEHHNGTLIILMEHCDTTLHEILAFRKFHDWKWSHSDVASILLDLATAVCQMEKIHLAHRDIRPHNIWYSSEKKCFKIGGFQDAKFLKKTKTQSDSSPLAGLTDFGIIDNPNNADELLNTIRGVPDFLAPEVEKYLEYHQQVGKYNPFSTDIYQLGVCLAMMVYLSVDVKEKELQDFIKKSKKEKSSNKKNLASKSYWDIIKIMLNGDEASRITAAELQLYVTALKKNAIKIDEDNIVKSMRFKKKIVGPEATKVYRLIAIAYFDLFEWEKWQEKMEEIYVTYENNKDEKGQASILYEIAQGLLDIGNSHNAFEYFFRASVIFNEQGHKERRDGHLEKAIESYGLALDCVRKANSGEDCYEGALLLENLGNAYRMKGDQTRARSYLEETQRIIAQEKGEDSIENAKVLISVCKIYTMMGDYKLALKRNKKALKIIDILSSGDTKSSVYMQQSMISTSGQSKQVQILRASALQALGEIARLQEKIGKAQQYLEEALQIRQQIQGNGHLDVASTLENLGNLSFQKKEYDQAKQFYEKSLIIKKSKLGDANDEIAITLNNLGNTCKNLHEPEKAQKFFTDAITLLKNLHPAEDHYLIGTTYGNFGIFLKSIGKKDAARHCLEKCVIILKQNLDASHPDQEFYQNNLRMVDVDLVE